MAELSKEERAGWGFPAASRKAHYFDGDLISLCGKWVYSGPLEPDEGTSKDDCAACRKKLDKAKATAQSGEVAS
jgi:hypothetical protein